MARAGRLFRTMVVLGASVGCGSSSTIEVAPPSLEPVADAVAPSGNVASPTMPTDCAEPSQFHCDGTGPGACTCNLEAPNSVCDCTRPGEFRCHQCLSGPPVLGRCPNDDGVDCFCNTSIAVASPADCASPAQFVCDEEPVLVDGGFSGGPYSGWFAFAECECDATRPTSASDCPAMYELACDTVQACQDPPSPDIDVDCSCFSPSLNMR